MIDYLMLKFPTSASCYQHGYKLTSERILMNDNHNGTAIVSVAIADEQSLREKIYNIRGQQVMLSFDLADIYGYEHKRFMEQVRNNKEKFDDDFMFQLSKEEYDNLKTIFSTSSDFKLGRSQKASICIYRARHLYAHDGSPRRSCSQTKQSSDQAFQAYERLYQRKPCVNR